MMKFLSPLSLLFATLFSLQAAAAHVRGNGGDVIVCSAQSAEPVTLLDYFEATRLYGLVPDLGPQSLSTLEKVALVLSRIPNFDEGRRIIYQERAQQFFNDTNFLSGVHLTDVPDSRQVVLPEGCSLAQIAIQEEPLFPEARRYIVNQDLWEQMDSDNQAGLILHEIIYRESLSHGQSDSVRTRYFNAILSSGRISRETPVSYNNLMRSIGFPNDCLSARDFAIGSTNEICFEYGSYDSKTFTGRLAGPQKLLLGIERNQPLWATFVGEVTLHWNHLLRQGRLAEPFRTHPSGTVLKIRHDQHYVVEITPLKE